MSASHCRTQRRACRLLSLVAVLGLGVTAAPAYAVPQPPADPMGAAQQVGAWIVDINTRMSFQGAVGAGTGIVIDPNGVVLTNNHVIASSTSLTARDVGNGQTYDGDVIGYDRNHDVAVVQLRGAHGLPVANIGDSNLVRVGESTVSLGNAGGSGGAPSVVPGSVTALNQTVSAQDSLTGAAETLTGLIQLDAGIRPGDSGGPTVNASNQVIGMNTAASDKYRLGRGEGFAIPINQAMDIAGQIRSGAGSATVHIGPTAFLGLGVVDAPGGGALVKQVVPSGPAAGAGIHPGDVINSIDGAPIDSATALTDILDQHHPGDGVVVALRNGDAPSVLLATGPPG